MRTAPITHRLAAVAVLALVATSAAACGDDDTSTADDAPSSAATTAEADNTPALTEDQLSQVVLAPENFPGDWTQTPSEDDDSTGPGCLGEVSTITDAVQESAKVAYDYTYGDAGIPLISSSASAFDDHDAVVEAFDHVQEVLAGCSTVTGSDSDGAEYDLTLTYSDELTSDVVDDQISLDLTGTITAQGDQAAISESITLVRMGPNVLTTAMLDLGDSSTVAVADDYAQIALDRLVAVVLGDSPDATVGPEVA
ncbi:MAG TPA: hypothetical protein VNS55_06520 [Nocardioides sp.]|nr:hypothetical protein [Nocardioides sp.]